MEYFKSGTYVRMTDYDSALMASYGGTLRNGDIGEVQETYNGMICIKDDVFVNGDPWLDSTQVEVVHPLPLQDIEFAFVEVLHCVGDNGRGCGMNDFTKGKDYHISTNEDGERGIYSDSGFMFTNNMATHSLFVVKELAKPKHTPFSDLSDSEKGTLLLAAHDAQPIQVWDEVHHWCDCEDMSTHDFDETESYRVTPQEVLDLQVELEDLSFDIDDIKNSIDELTTSLTHALDKRDDLKAKINSFNA